MMDFLKRVFGPAREQQYEPVGEDTSDPDQLEVRKQPQPFSWTNYSIFLLLGVAMLWAWNMFLAANPYFQRRFASNKRIFHNFQSAVILSATVANLGTVLVLTKKQAGASYPTRIIVSLVISIISFCLLALSAVFFLDISVGAYLTFVLITVFVASIGTGMIQNGVFAYVQGFGQSKYMQGIMVGQAIAGVLPCIAQIVTVQIAGVDEDARHSPVKGADQQSAKAALSYFLVAVAVSSVTLLSFFVLRRQEPPIAAVEGDGAIHRRPVAIWTLFKKLPWHSTAIFYCFALTMQFPIFTQLITSVRSPEDTPSLLRKDSFIPLGLLAWNLGDLGGRMITILPFFARPQYPKLVLIVSLTRTLFIPLYHLCNINGNGAVVNSDAFYFVVVQFGFGLSNGWVGSTCMMAPAFYVNDNEKEAAGGYMGLMLVAGLSVGSVLSFLAANK